MKNPILEEKLVRFDTIAEMRLYTKRLLDHYQKQVDVYGEMAGELMREILKRDGARPKPEKKVKNKRQAWEKMGNMLVNATDELLGKNEVTLQVLEEYKSKLLAVKDVLRSFEELDRLNLVGSSSILLHLREGVPERIIVEHSQAGAHSESAKAQF